MPTLKEIHCFPIKGFSGKKLNSILLKKGNGIENDRRFAFAISDGIDGKEWVASKNFLINSRHDGLLKYQTDFDDEKFSIISPDGQALILELSDPNGLANFNSKLREFFGLTGIKIHLVERIKEQKPFGMWDYVDTQLSIINLASVRELSNAIGVELDPKRFRGNILIDDLQPFEEFSMSGFRYKIGEAEIAMTRPIDRCPATGVNPENGERDVSTPSLLANHYGHGFFGIYAQIVKSGAIKPDDKLERISPEAHSHKQFQPSNAPDYSLWPKLSAIETVDDNQYELRTKGPWPLLNSSQSNGKRMRLHVGRDEIVNAEVQKIEHDIITVTANLNENKIAGGTILVSGPFGKITDG